MLSMENYCIDTILGRLKRVYDYVKICVYDLWR